MYGEDAVTDWTRQKWFAEFPVRDFLLDDAPQSGRLVKLTSIKENNQHYTMWDITDILKMHVF